jgi:glycosyltransferase involved in cell wall biosynthesis
VAVVVLNYNGRALLPDCLGGLARLSTPARLVVADNGSSDGSRDEVRQCFPQVETLDLGRNWGFAAGYNEAIRQIDNPWLVLLNNDATLAPDWLAQLLAWAADHPAAGILGGKLLFQPGAADAPAVLQSAGASFTDAGTAFEIGWGTPDHGQYDTPRPVGAIPGAAMLVRRELFLALGVLFREVRGGGESPGVIGEIRHLEREKQLSLGDPGANLHQDLPHHPGGGRGEQRRAARCGSQAPNHDERLGERILDRGGDAHRHLGDAIDRRLAEWYGAVPASGQWAVGSVIGLEWLVAELPSGRIAPRTRAARRLQSRARPTTVRGCGSRPGMSSTA